MTIISGECGYDFEVSQLNITYIVRNITMRLYLTFNGLRIMNPGFLMLVSTANPAFFMEFRLSDYRVARCSQPNRSVNGQYTKNDFPITVSRGKSPQVRESELFKVLSPMAK